MDETFSSFQEALGRVFWKHRKRTKKLTLQDVADKSGFSLGYISQIEHGKNSPSLDTCLALCDALGVALSDVIAQAEQMYVPKKSK
jgi:transcriptional regulator with XRE-family HTH domain